MKGTTTALITPFADEKIDEEGFAHNIRFQIEAGIDALLVLGSTGESSTLTAQEKECVIKIAVQEIRGRVPLLVNTGTYSTRETIEKTKQAKELGADIALVVVPYFNKPTQEGIYRHFEAIAKNCDIPIIIYNVPSRVGVGIEVSTLCRLSTLPNIIGVKEASDNVMQVGDVIAALCDSRPDFTVLSGDDVFTLPMMALGAHGVISVVSNLLPKEVCSLVRAALKGDLLNAQVIHYKLLKFFKAAFIETNPIPIKAAMNLSGMPAGPCRLPLCDLSSQHFEYLRELICQRSLLEC